MRPKRAAVLAILLAASAPLVATCLGDQASGLAFGGREYRGFGGSVFAIDPAALTGVGRPERINTPGTDGRVYVLPGVPLRDAVVTRGPGADLTVFVAGIDGGMASAPLGVAIPGLCPYLVDPLREGCLTR